MQKINLKSLVKLLISLIILIGVTACTTQELENKALVLVPNKDKIPEGFNNLEFDAKITFNKNLNPDSVQKGKTVELKDSNGKVIDSDDYRIIPVENQLVIIFTKPQDDKDKIKVTINGIEDNFGKSVNAVQEVKLTDRKKPQIVSYNLGFNMLFRAINPLVIEFSEKMQPDFYKKVSLQRLDGKQIPANFYKFTNNNDNNDNKLALEILDDNFKDKAREVKILFNAITDVAGNSLSRESLDFTILDSIAPTFIKDDLPTDRKIKSNLPILLTFSEALKKETIKTENIQLWHNNAQIDANANPKKYQLEFDENKPTQVKLTLLDEVLKNKTDEFKIKIQKLEDLSGNLFKNGTSQEQFLTFNFIESIPPTFTKDNLSPNREIKSNLPILLTFSEALKKETIKTENIQLWHNVIQIEPNKYQLEFDENNPTQIKLTLLDKYLQDITDTFQIKIQGITDLEDNIFADTNPLPAFTFIDSIAPTFIKDNLSDLSPRKIKSNLPILLTFSEALKEETIKAENIQLWHNNAQIDANANPKKYQLEFDENNPTQVKLTLLDEALRDKTDTFQVKIQKLEDLKDNLFANINPPQAFTFIDSVPPKFKLSNVDLGFWLKETTSDQKIKIQFNEPLDAETIIKNKDILFDNEANPTLEASYDNAINSIIFTPGSINGSEYTITIPTSVTDKAGNALTEPLVLKFINEKIKNQIIYATPEGAGAKNGTSWTNAKTLNTALDNATEGDVIFAFAGTYHPTDADTPFTLKKQVRIFGGFTDTQTNVRDFSKSILDGKLPNNTFAKIIVKAENLQNTILDGFVIQNAKNPKKKGSAIYADDSVAIFKNLTIKDNTAENGGAVYVQKGLVSFRNSKFLNNNATKDGGAIYLESKVTGDAELKMDNIKFSYNKAYNNGGAICAGNRSSFVITNSDFIENKAKDGGAIYGTLRLSLKNLKFIRNEAVNNGGAISKPYLRNHLSAPQYINNSVFLKNKAKNGNGGAIYIDNTSASVYIRSSTFYGNSANYGGALYGSVYSKADTTSLKIYESIFWNNKVLDEKLGKNIYIGFSGYDENVIVKPHIQNSILNADSVVKAKNYTYLNDTEIYDFMVQNSFEAKNTSGILETYIRTQNNKTDDPLFVDAEADNLRLKLNSPAIDAGTNDSKIFGLVLELWLPELDVDGKPRIQGDANDMGAYEFQPTP